MTASPIAFQRLMIPDEEITNQAARVVDMLGPVLNAPTASIESVVLTASKQTLTIELPPEVLEFLAEILLQISRGNAVRLEPLSAEVTTQQAAELLNVPRAHLVGLLDDDEIPYRRVNRHRRIRLTDLLAYKHEMKERQRKALDELSAEAQRMGLYD